MSSPQAKCREYLAALSFCLALSPAFAVLDRKVREYVAAAAEKAASKSLSTNGALSENLELCMEQQAQEFCSEARKLCKMALDRCQFLTKTILLLTASKKRFPFSILRGKNGSF